VVDAAVVRIRVPRAAVILAVYVMLALLVGVIGYVVIPSVVRDVHTLSHDAPHYAAQLRHNTTFRHYDDRYHITATLLQDAHRLPELLARAAGPLKMSRSARPVSSRSSSPCWPSPSCSSYTAANMPSWDCRWPAGASSAIAR
jgi:hypothetical protein